MLFWINENSEFLIIVSFYYNNLLFLFCSHFNDTVPCRFFSYNKSCLLFLNVDNNRKSIGGRAHILLIFRKRLPV